MANHPHDPHPAPVMESSMDYAQHEATYGGFLALLKFSIISIAILVVGLYFAIIAGQPILGIVLIVASVVVPGVMTVMGRK